MQPERVQHEDLHDDEPRYLRRQRPLEIKRRRFSRHSRSAYRSVFFGVTVVLAAAGLVYAAVSFLLHSPRVALADVSQVEVIGNRTVPADTIREFFTEDQNRSILRIPLNDRRTTIEQIPWVERAEVIRLFPNRLRVNLIERTPVAFLRAGSELALIDVNGVILDRPPVGDFRFPIVVGLVGAVPREERARRMLLFVQFAKEIELARSGASETVSEVDLSDPRDLRASLEPGAGIAVTWDAPILVHFGDGDFLRKYAVFMENIPQWLQSAGRIESIDLRFERQAVVNPEKRVAASPAPAAVAKSKPQPQRVKPVGKSPAGPVAAKQ